MQTQDRQVKGITDIIFTVGKKETKAFASQNDASRAKGESYFVRVKNDVGSKEKIGRNYRLTKTSSYLILY